MSGLVNGAAASQFEAFTAALERRTQTAYLPDIGGVMFADVDFVAPSSFVSEYWPGGAYLLDDVGGSELIVGVRWGAWDQAAGASSRFGFTGVTRDQYGSAVGGCTVKLYRTSDDMLLDSQVSDPNGNFLLSTAYYPDTHYIVAHKSGSPDIDGVTPNTLIGA